MKIRARHRTGGEPELVNQRSLRLCSAHRSTSQKRALKRVFSINSDGEMGRREGRLGGVWMKGGKEGGGGGRSVSMAAVAVATTLQHHHHHHHEGVRVWECGRLCEGQGSCVPSSLVWVSVPASGSASSNAPGSLNGLSLREEEAAD